METTLGVRNKSIKETVGIFKAYLHRCSENPLPLTIGEMLANRVLLLLAFKTLSAGSAQVIKALAHLELPQR